MGKNLNQRPRFPMSRCKHISRHRSTNNRGFSLVEVMIAGGLMAIVIAGTLGLLRQGLYYVELARDQTRIAQVLQSEIEDLRTLNWADLTSYGEDETFIPQGTFVEIYGDRYTCRRIITTTATDQRQVQVTATWTDSHSKTRTMSYFTRFTKEGLNDYYYRAL